MTATGRLGFLGALFLVCLQAAHSYPADGPEFGSYAADPAADTAMWSNPEPEVTMLEEPSAASDIGTDVLVELVERIEALQSEVEGIKREVEATQSELAEARADLEMTEVALEVSSSALEAIETLMAEPEDVKAETRKRRFFFTKSKPVYVPLPYPPPYLSFSDGPRSAPASGKSDDSTGLSTANGAKAGTLEIDKPASEKDKSNGKTEKSKTGGKTAKDDFHKKGGEKHPATAWEIEHKKEIVKHLNDTIHKLEKDLTPRISGCAELHWRAGCMGYGVPSSSLTGQDATKTEMTIAKKLSDDIHQLEDKLARARACTGITFHGKCIRTQVKREISELDAGFSADYLEEEEKEEATRSFEPELEAEDELEEEGAVDEREVDEWEDMELVEADEREVQSNPSVLASGYSNW